MDKGSLLVDYLESVALRMASSSPASEVEPEPTWVSVSS